MLGFASNVKNVTVTSGAAMEATRFYMMSVIAMMAIGCCWLRAYLAHFVLFWASLLANVA